MPASLKQNIILNNNSLQKMNAASDLRVCNLGFSSNFSAMTIIILMITFDVWSSEWYRFSPALLYSICDGMSFECVLCKTYRYLYFSSLCLLHLHLPWHSVQLLTSEALLGDANWVDCMIEIAEHHYVIIVFRREKKVRWTNFMKFHINGVHFRWNSVQIAQFYGKHCLSFK